MGYSPRLPGRVVVHAADSGEYTYRNATFLAHDDGDLSVKDKATGDLVAVWARGQWQRVTAPRS